jgi:hypothetical protein
MKISGQDIKFKIYWPRNKREDKLIWYEKKMKEEKEGTQTVIGDISSIFYTHDTIKKISTRQF